MEILISGASTGIGRATAVHLARLGHSVWAGVRSEQVLEATRKLKVRGLEPILLDVTDGQSVSQCVRQITKNSGLLHGLVNNAGVVVAGPVEALDAKAWQEQFDVNFFGAVRLTKECLPLLRESKGRIVNMSSISGRVAAPFLGPYSASKFALEGFSDSLRRELAPFGVHVAVIEPGPIATPIWQKSLKANEKRKEQSDSETLAVYEKQLNLFMTRFEKAERNAAPVLSVVHAVTHALTAPSPKIRYPVGPGISLASAASRLLPDAWMDRWL